jgi:hypothetical protein
MKLSRALPVVLLALLLMSGCKVGVNSGGARFNGGGVTFVAPMQTSQVSEGPGGIDYKSEAFNASTDGKTLLVNGQSYGSLKTGDVVDFTEAGVVKVNGVVRPAENMH